MKYFVTQIALADCLDVQSNVVSGPTFRQLTSFLYEVITTETELVEAGYPL